MSKSLGKIIDPQVVIKGGKNQKEALGYGAIVLGLWVPDPTNMELYYPLYFLSISVLVIYKAKH